MPKISFLGAVGEVTGSKILIINGQRRVLLDCGMFQGYKDEAYLKNKHFDENTPEIDDLILSHAHVDHSGLIPSIVKNGYEGNIYSTPATTDLCKHMLKDSAKVYIKELPIIGKMLRRKKDHTKVRALYNEADVEKAMGQFVNVDYEQVKQLTRNTSFTFHDSCHILGSASIKVKATDKNIDHKIWYTSDIGHDRSMICNEPQIPLDINHLIIETTYGNKKRPEDEDIYQGVLEAVNDANRRGGKTIIPSFSVGRMQNIIIILHKLYLMGAIPDIPIYVDSPLGVKVTNLYDKYINTINEDTLNFFKERNVEPLKCPLIKYVSSPEDSQAICEDPSPAIIVSASGMCEGGHIREHLKTAVGDKNSTVLFVGYNGEGTLGRRLQDCNGQVTIDGTSFRVRCKVETLHGFSAHADLKYLVDYVERCTIANNIRTIFLIHGDVDAAQNVKNILHSKGIDNIVIPELGKEYKLGMI